jgi:hypothetical protein
LQWRFESQTWIQEDTSLLRTPLYWGQHFNPKLIISIQFSLLYSGFNLLYSGDLWIKHFVSPISGVLNREVPLYASCILSIHDNSTFPRRYKFRITQEVNEKFHAVVWNPVVQIELHHINLTTLMWVIDLDIDLD